MPIYEYECDSCGTFEVEQRISEEPLKTCPQCSARGNSSPIKRVISASAFHLKGGGWYKSDYSNKKSDNNKESGSSAAEKTSTATETKSDAATQKTASCGTNCGCTKAE